MKIIVSIAGKTYLDMKYNDLTPYGLDWAGYIPIAVSYTHLNQSKYWSL